MLSHGVMHRSVLMDCSEPFPKHSKGIRQTPHAPQADAADTAEASNCLQQSFLHMTPPGRGDRDHLFDAVLVRVAGHLGTAGSTCPHVPSVTEDMEAPARHLLS